jgi:hypothetical protein
MQDTGSDTVASTGTRYVRIRIAPSSAQVSTSENDG